MKSIGLRRPLQDLGSLDASLAGILSPGYTDAELDRHIHDLFRDKYEEYMRPFPLSRAGIDHWKGLIRAAIPENVADSRAPLTILDIGSGEGTSVFPLIELFPNAHIIASDLSTPLLRALRRWHGQHYPGHDQLWVMQLDAEETVFEDNQIDIVTGAHILHHLGDLSKALREIRRVLKPGGVAAFWEGFEAGCQIVSLTMQLLIAKSDAMPASGQIRREIVAGFREFMADLHRRRGGSKSEALLETIDDKWLFTKTQLDEVARAAGLDLAGIHSVYRPDDLIATMLEHELRRKLFSLEALPDWARELVSGIEDQFSRELKSETLYGGAIILSKGPTKGL
jgi:ubiquinone/menaquinone biosynthesis C-methylase UbiE